MSVLLTVCCVLCVVCCVLCVVYLVLCVELDTCSCASTRSPSALSAPWVNTVPGVPGLTIQPVDTQESPTASKSMTPARVTGTLFFDLVDAAQLVFPADAVPETSSPARIAMSVVAPPRVFVRLCAVAADGVSSPDVDSVAVPADLAKYVDMSRVLLFLLFLLSLWLLLLLLVLEAG